MHDGLGQGELAHIQKTKCCAARGFWFSPGVTKKDNFIQIVTGSSRPLLAGHGSAGNGFLRPADVAEGANLRANLVGGLARVTAY